VYESADNVRWNIIREEKQSQAKGSGRVVVDQQIESCCGRAEVKRAVTSEGGMVVKV